MLSEDEKRALRQKQKLLYSSGQFPLRSTTSGRRPRKPMSPLKALALGVVVVLGVLVALVAILTTAGQ